MAGWIGVDLDGTLAHFDRWRGPRHIGLPIPAMAKRVHDWHARGVEVRIFTARASRPELIPDVQTWLKRHGFPPLAVTNQKDFGMVELWDDRAIQVLYNTGKAVRPNRLEDVEKAELFDPDEDVVYADDGAEKKDHKPSEQEVEEFKRSIQASSDNSIDSLDDLLDALDDGEYAPGDAPEEPNAIKETAAIAPAASLVQTVAETENEDDDFLLDEPEEALDDTDLPLDATGFVSVAEEDLLTPAHAVVEIELSPDALDAADATQEIDLLDETTDTVTFDPLPETEQVEESIDGTQELPVQPVSAAEPVTEAEPADEKLDNTLDDQPISEANHLDDLGDLNLDSALDDVPSDLRSVQQNDSDEHPRTSPIITAFPDDDLDDYLDDLPAFKVDRR